MWVVSAPRCTKRKSSHLGDPLPDGPQSDPSRFPGAKGNGPWDPEIPIPGVNNIQGCGCGPQPGGVVPIGPFSERVIPGGHAGECAESPLCGTWQFLH
ncbi:uncharacterized protein LOC100030265 isoform X2 [Monodelphis domestica]|uniref:uncharacterized protein LOC100030265 isoform X2 n=1 Tax=Monodelphis domestica TaxID=13616 RepID=UPI0024E234D3|nr:uncharacterized protein LOC100030265 isoform X2 [Monodelphis domestica]